MWYILFFASFFVWLCPGWDTLHNLGNREYFTIFSTHIYFGSLCSCFACTQVYQSPLGLWPTAAIHNCICPSNHFLPLKQSSWNLSRYLNFEKSQLKIFSRTGDWTQVHNSKSCLWCMYCWKAFMPTWIQKLVALDWGSAFKALSFEVPCRCSWCRCHTYPTWS